MARRQRGEGSLFKRASDGRWVGRVDLGWADGKRQRKTVYGRTQAEAMRELRRARKAAEEGNRNTAGQTLEKWLATWLDDICPGKPAMKPRTLANYRSYVRNYLVPSIGKVRLDRLAPQHVRQLHAYVAAEGRSSTTVGHAHRILGTALNDALRESQIVRNPVTLVPAPANADAGRRALSVAEVRRFFAAVEGDRLASRWHTSFLLGVRQGECLGLRWSALDLDGGVADVSTQLQRIPYRHGCKPPCGKRADHCPQRELAVQPGFRYEQLDGNLCLQRPKTKRSTRVVPLPEPLVVSLRDRHRRYLAERPDYGAHHDLVWTRIDGRPLDPGADRLAWHLALRGAGIEDTDQHSARHTTATLLLALGVPEHVIVSILGHADAVTTRGYQHVDLTMQRQAMAQLGSALWSPGEPVGQGQ